MVARTEGLVPGIPGNEALGSVIITGTLRPAGGLRDWLWPQAVLEAGAGWGVHVFASVYVCALEPKTPLREAALNVLFLVKPGKTHCGALASWLWSPPCHPRCLTSLISW